MLGWEDWCILVFTTLLVGVGKIGFSGLSLVTISVFAAYFGKSSVGVLLPLLVIADFTVYPVMRKYGTWQQVWPLMPPTLIGIGCGIVLLRFMPEVWAKPVIGSLIVLMLGVILWKRLCPMSRLDQSYKFGVISAFGGGVSTTLANAAGPVMNIYLLTRGFHKMELVGIAGRFFLLTNLIKLPLLGGISLITADSLLINLKLAPIVVLGVFLGKWLLKRVPQKVFSYLIIVFAIIAAVNLLCF